MKLLLCLLIYVAFALPVKAYRCVSKVDTLSAATIISRSERAYSRAGIYLDSGKAIQSFTIMGSPYKTAKLFKTAYADDGSFNFEYYELGKSNSLYTINRLFKVVRTWWAVTNKSKTPATINLALEEAAGVSNRLSLMIPQLLLTSDFKKNNMFNSLKTSSVSGVEQVSNIACYKIVAEEKNELGKITFWIAQKDFLIRKIETEIFVDPVKTMASVHRADSIMTQQHKDKKDTAAIKRDSMLKATLAHAEAMMKMLATADTTKAKGYTVKTSYMFFPYKSKNPNPELFKFRPNREIEL